MAVLFSCPMSFFQSIFCNRGEILDALQPIHCTDDKLCVDLPNYAVYTEEEYKSHLKCLAYLEHKGRKVNQMSWMRGIRDNIPC